MPLDQVANAQLAGLRNAVQHAGADDLKALDVLPPQEVIGRGYHDDHDRERGEVLIATAVQWERRLRVCDHEPTRDCAATAAGDPKPALRDCGR